METGNDRLSASTLILRTTAVLSLLHRFARPRCLCHIINNDTHTVEKRTSCQRCFFMSCRFHVDFIKGPDVVFHFNPRFPEQTIVRNSNLGGCWGPEEREGGFPFVQGQRFEVKCYINGKKSAEFIHNLAPLCDSFGRRCVGVCRLD